MQSKLIFIIKYFWVKRKNILILLSIILLFSSFSIKWYSIHKSIEEKDNEYFSNCGYTKSMWIFTINASCIQQKKLPQLPLAEIIDAVWDNIDWFSWYYEPLSNSFNYYWATPIFKTKWNLYLQWEPSTNKLVLQAIESRERVSFSYKELAQYYAQHLSYFVADKDLTNLGNCSRKNYLLALNWIDWYILNPWNTFNINQKLSSLWWYCKWISNESHSFYWWVCGMVSQLFRVSLINPDIVINKRYPHNEWFVQYYWENIWGDDAAVYEYSKQFEIKNTGESDIILKTRNNESKSIIVAISWPTNKWVNITKNFINWNTKAIHLNKTVYQYNDTLGNVVLREEVFDSYYSKKSYEFR